MAILSALCYPSWMILRAFRAGVVGLVSSRWLCLLLAFASLLTASSFAGPGDVDLSFNGGTGPNAIVYATQIRTNDDKIYIGGTFDGYNGNLSRRIARLTVTGAFDPTFATPGCESSVNAIALQGLQCIIVGDFTSVGNTTTRRVARLNDNGSLDAAFTLNMGQGADNGVDAVHTQPDGKVLIAGRFLNFDNVARKRLARLNADGSLDTSFDPQLGPNGPVVSIDVQPDGKIILCGNFTTYNGVAGHAGIVRLNADGSLDASFVATASGLVNGVVIQSSGKIIVFGGFNFFNGQSRTKIVRLNADGTLDAPYSALTTINSDIRDAEQLANGKLLIVGVFFQINGESRRGVARLDLNGNHDPGFNPGTGAGFNDGQTTVNNANVNASALDSLNRLFIVGEFRDFNQIPFNFITRVGTADPSPPLIITQPVSLTIEQGSNATFSVGASPPPLTYQWRFNGLNLLNATNNSITITNAQPANGGPYSVVVANSVGNITSSNATLTVLVRPFFVTPPVSITNVVGANVSFSVTAGGTAPLFYQWVFNGLPLAGQTNPTLNLNNIQVTNAGPYTIIVSNAVGAVTNSATLTIPEPPAIIAGPGGGNPATGQPQSLTVVQGQNATFSANAVGSAPLSYQWRFAGINILGATNTTVTLTNVLPSQAGLYSVVISNPFGNTTSADATLTVLIPPLITPGAGGGGPDGQPQSLTVVQGQNATFSANAIGTAPLAYQWRFGGVNIPGATGPSLTLLNVVPSQAGLYSVAISNLGGTATSLNATLTVLTPPLITPGVGGGGPDGQPQSLTVVQGQNATFSVNAIGTAPLTYQWRFGGVNIP